MQGESQTLRERENVRKKRKRHTPMKTQLRFYTARGRLFFTRNIDYVCVCEYFFHIHVRARSLSLSISLSETSSL